MTVQPSLYLSHGSPMMLLENSPAREFLCALPNVITKPDAIVIISGHWEADVPLIASAAQPQTIYDFYGFPQPLYQLTYPAPGNPQLAQEVANLLSSAGFAPHLDQTYGFDHGTWVPLILAYPECEIPVLPISLLDGPAANLALGKALAPLRQRNVLVIGSGTFTHNGRAFPRGRDRNVPPIEPLAAFRSWVHEALFTGDTDALLDYRARAPYATKHHPSEDHFLPLFVALGAGEDGPVKLLHESASFGTTGMDSFAFG